MHKISAIMSFLRKVDPPDDIKTALDKARKMYGKDFGQLNKRTRVNLDDMVLPEEEFEETGGVMGYMERGRNLLQRNQLSSSIQYVSDEITKI